MSFGEVIEIKVDTKICIKTVKIYMRMTNIKFLSAFSGGRGMMVRVAYKGLQL